MFMIQHYTCLRLHPWEDMDQKPPEARVPYKPELLSEFVQTNKRLTVFLKSL